MSGDNRMGVIKAIFTILSVILVVSCSEMNSQFDCPMKSGIHCESIDSVNSRIDRGEIGHVGMISSSDNRLDQMPIYKNSNIASSTTSFKGDPLRYGETVQRVWVAPFEDRQGNYHQESNIFTVSKPGNWIGYPLKELSRDGE